MTAPTTAIADITAHIAVVQARIAAIAPSRTTATNTGSTSFASELASATGTTTATTAAPLALGGSGGTTGSAVVADAQKYLGIPYVWGGESTSGMDCSGLVQKTFGDLGVSLPRTAAEQQQQGTPVDSLADAQPGDLLFFGSPAYHVAIYAGNNQLIESPEPGKTVHVTDVYQTPTSIRRIAAPDTAPVSSLAGSSASIAPMSLFTGASGVGLSATQLTSAGVNPAVATYADKFGAAERAFNLPSGLLAAVAQQESGGNASAVSPAGAQGLMQLMPSTAAGMGVNALDPNQAIDAAARILSRNLSHYNGSVPLALAAYNAGMGAVDSHGGIPPYTETQNYVRSITAMMAAGG